MAEYIDIDAQVVVTDTRGRELETTVRHIFEMNKGVYTAADVRPVVRGQWIEHYEPYSTGEEWLETQYGYECSICGRWEYEKEPFCNCGAMMEES